jgi:O-antigen/teichoic acid export membrane protein
MNSPSLEEYLPLVSIYVFLMISSSFFETSMIAEGQAHYAALVKTGSEITRSVFVIIVALFSHKITLVLEALVLFALLRFLIQGIYLFKKYKLSLTQFEISFFRRMLGYSLPIGMSNTTYMLQKKLHSLVVSCFFNPTSFAIYSIGSFNLPIVGFVTSSVGQVMTPELSKCHKYGEKKRIISVWANAMRKQYIMIFPIFWFFLIMGYEFVVFMFTEQYIQSVPIFRISLFNLLIAGINTGAFLQAYAQTRYMLKIGLVRLPVALSVLYLCTKNFGMTGAIAADVFVSMAFRFFVVSKVVSVAAVSYKSIIMWSEIIKIFIIAFLAGLPILAIKFFINLNPFNMLAVSFPLYCICYLVLSSYYKIFQTKDIPFLSNILSGKYKYLTK